jgi:hypothetical protein
MNIEIVRGKSSSKSTIGKMSIDGVFQCYTLEDVTRAQKITGMTAIPAGDYKVIINLSNRFQRLLPLVLDVPGFSGIRIHPGNKAEDTEGCILVGTTAGEDFIGNSRIAFHALFEKMRKTKEITLSIKGESWT